MTKDTTMPTEPDYELQFCQQCGVMTNHLNGKCQKSLHRDDKENQNVDIDLRELRLFLKACGLGVVDAAHAEEIVRKLFATALHKAEVRGQIKEHKVIVGAVDEAHNTSRDENLDGLALFDDWRASRYKDLVRRLATLDTERKVND